MTSTNGPSDNDSGSHKADVPDSDRGDSRNDVRHSSGPSEQDGMATERRRLARFTARMTALRDQRAAEMGGAQANVTMNAEHAAGQDDEPARFQPFRTGFFGAFGVILAYITYLAVDSVRDTLIVIAVAAVVAIGLEPAVQFFIRRKFRRAWAVTTVFFILLAALAGAVYAIVPPIVTEVIAFVQSIPGIVKNLENNSTIQNLDKKFHIIDQIQSSGMIQKLGGGAADSILTAGVTAAGVALDLIIILILALFFLAGFPKIKEAAYRLAPASKRTRVAELGDKVLKQMGGYLSGATIVALQAGIVAGVFSAIVGLPYPWAIALGAAILDFIPVVGPVIIGVAMTLLGFTQSLLIGLIAGLFYLVQHMFEAYWLYPRVMRRQVDISTATVVVAILIGGALLGVTGALLAVPFAAAVQLIIREVVVPIQDRS